jgi:hypothetical protein
MSIEQTVYNGDGRSCTVITLDAADQKRVQRAVEGGILFLEGERETIHFVAGEHIHAESAVGRASTRLARILVSHVNGSPTLFKAAAALLVDEARLKGFTVSETPVARGPFRNICIAPKARAKKPASYPA